MVMRVWWWDTTIRSPDILGKPCYEQYDMPTRTIIYSTDHMRMASHQQFLPCVVSSKYYMRISGNYHFTQITWKWHLTKKNWKWSRSCDRARKVIKKIFLQVLLHLILRNFFKETLKSHRRDVSCTCQRWFPAFQMRFCDLRCGTDHVSFSEAVKPQNRSPIENRIWL